ncbi:hypothetical protein HanXRQr2_Chr16g0770751 [Helianthus annuus]|uniref:Transmembrane protein n=1 Tax=Helianthus annuus TaxID=4232 RepID=A0A9K3DVQ8_HELAN|nr:hypothetical protein HanXRQr2_Chr16g0770751 [Helianthus annuus]KAJ0823027.1 hypothetical protein HanPSC8_Chr16g0738851 [Helianthus annuus]
MDATRMSYSDFSLYIALYRYVHLKVPPLGPFWRTPFRGFNSFKNSYLLVDALMMGKCFVLLFGGTFLFMLYVMGCCQLLLICVDSCDLRVIMMNWIWVVQDLL